MYHALGQRVWVMLWLRQLATGLSVRRPRFKLREVNVGFVVGLVALGQAFL